MVTDAQKRANAKYAREHVKQTAVKFYPSEEDIWNHLQAQENRMGYIKGLIRADMERQEGRG